METSSSLELRIDPHLACRFSAFFTFTILYHYFAFPTHPGHRQLAFSFFVVVVVFGQRFLRVGNRDEIRGKAYIAADNWTADIVGGFLDVLHLSLLTYNIVTLVLPPFCPHPIRFIEIWKYVLTWDKFELQVVLCS